MRSLTLNSRLRLSSILDVKNSQEYVDGLTLTKFGFKQRMKVVLHLKLKKKNPTNLSAG